MFRLFQEHERIEFINCDPSELPDYLGEFELVVVNNCLNSISDPEKFLSKLSNVVEDNGILIISSDYNWSRNTNQVSIGDRFHTEIIFDNLFYRVIVFPLLMSLISFQFLVCNDTF